VTITLRTVLEEKGTTVYSVDPETSIIETVQTMIRNNIGAVLVVANSRPVGIFTERDVLKRIVGAGRDPNRTKVVEVMTNNVAVLDPDTTIQQAMAVCTEKRLRHLPVMQKNEILGLVSAGDLTRRIADQRAKEIGSLIRYITGQYPG
jgi:CBS domain-containing protein